MAAFAAIDWTNSSEREQLAAVRRAWPEELNQILCEYDWSLYPETVLGWASAQRGITLCAAITSFFNADPMRFNYLPRSDVPAQYHGICRLLDAMAQRVNAGFYLPNVTHVPCTQQKTLRNWMYYQQEDVIDNRRGRWVFEEELIEPLLNPAPEVKSRHADRPVCEEARFPDLGALVKPLMNF
ncbi:hypothetical protein [Aquicoccus sp.]|uniref:hypothetical protein n=1 Tax=Aquicoccus sp. TaxID=2055851 RepID=UPI00356B4B20